MDKKEIRRQIDILKQKDEIISDRCRKMAEIDDRVGGLASAIKRANKRLNKSLYEAVEAEDLKSVKSCLAKGADPNKAFGLAMMKNNLPICQALLDSDLKPSRMMIASRSRYRYGTTGEYTYLGYAAGKNMVEIIRGLIDKGASLDGQVCGYTAIMIAAKRGKTLAVKELMTHKQHPDSVREALWLAARYGRTPSVKALLEHDDPDVFSYGNPKEKALMIAIEKNHTNVIKALISNGADVNKKDWNKLFTPLVWASMNSDASVVELLLQAGADPNLASSQDITPLNCAISRRMTDNIIALVNGGALIK